ncbi:MAG TPA: glycosyltransferase family 2 protein [Parafilimonas sp.]|nr:glycosyltransferase family 2 protein [Parafilimonas sp.]
MATEPLISIITPVYNRASLIPATIDSIIAQTYKDWELILVDDGSDNNTLNVLRQYEKKDTRVKVFERNRLPKGAQTCRNTGFQKAIGNFIIFLDSDDLLEDFCLEQRAKFMSENPALDFAIFPGLIFNEKKYDKNILVSDYKGDGIIPMLLGLTPPCVPGNNIWKRSSLAEKNVIWDENLKAFQDVDFHLMAAYSKLSFAYSDDPPDYFWRKHDLGNTGNELSKTDKLISHQYFFQKHVKILQEKNLYNQYKNYINRLAGQLILLAFKSNNAGDAKTMISFFKGFGKPLSRIKTSALLFLGSMYKSGGLLKALSRINVYFLYPSVFPLFKNKNFAKIKWTGNL